MAYTALLADIVESKKIPKEEREKTQLFIKTCLKTLNRIFQPSLEFDVIFSAGDEVQGLFKSPTPAFLYFRLLRMLLAPLRIRCGIGVGEWNVKIPNGSSSEQDGPAFHNARDAIAHAYDKNTHGVLFYSGNENDVFVNTLANTSLLFFNGQSRSQRQAALLLEWMLPFFDKDTMDLEVFVELQPIIWQKTGLLSNDQSENNNTLNSNAANFEPVYLFLPAFFERKIILNSTLKKGLSTRIAKFTNTSRQNIDKMIRTGNIAEIRNMEAATALLIYKTFGR